MSETFEQGWAARPFKEQFPELDDKTAERLDRLNTVLVEMLLNDLITPAQSATIREKRFPKLVAKEVNKARRRKGGAA